MSLFPHHQYYMIDQTITVHSYKYKQELCCMCTYLDFTTPSIIVTSIVHSKLDSCNSLCYSLIVSQLNILQQIQNSLGHAIINALKLSHTTPILKYLHII